MIFLFSVEVCSWDSDCFHWIPWVKKKCNRVPSSGKMAHFHILAVLQSAKRIGAVLCLKSLEVMYFEFIAALIH